MSEPVHFGATALKYLYGRGALPVGITSPNPGDIPPADGPDAIGVPHEVGRLREWTFELSYITISGAPQNGNLYLEGSLDLALWSPMSYHRLDTGALISSASPLVIAPNTTLLIGVSRGLSVMGVRPRFYLDDDQGDGDYCFIRSLEML
jgi:hypothetical protein